MHASYNSLGKDFKALFEELMRHIGSQRSESESLRRQVEAASESAVQSNVATSTQIQSMGEEER